MDLCYGIAESVVGRVRMYFLSFVAFSSKRDDFDGTFLLFISFLSLLHPSCIPYIVCPPANEILNDMRCLEAFRAHHLYISAR